MGIVDILMKNEREILVDEMLNMSLLAEKKLWGTRSILK